ncbi:hypothetical protein MNBD_IGNAVI01-2227 [hydrothermal vent metagenome]|uniref:SGNH hydrolase-type esterase domain-containing protein n=1 Tax=hydrothermal vent metagenome TaxID=652676 RepID=A0A3B1BW82_9ZZZZ
MKRTNRLVVLFFSILLITFIGCEDRTELTAPQPPKTGEADFTRFVSIGNSLTAGYQNSSLYEKSQIFSFGKIIADQVMTDYVQPLISEPGIPGKLEIEALAPDVVIAPNPGTGSPTNLGYAKPYNNLGVPGAILYDLVDTTDFQQKAVARGNPFFSVVLRDQQLGKSIIQQALNLQPTFITLWIGNNDVLGYATSGGTKGTDPATGKLPTDVPTFSAIYNMVGAAITDPTGARKIAAANIPDVQNIPFFTTVGPKIAASLEGNGVPAMVYQKNGETIGTGVATIANLKEGKVLITLTGGGAATLLGDTTGKYYASLGITPPAGIDITKPFGFDPQNPWPDVFILDDTEIDVTKNATKAFNKVISDVVSLYSSTWVLVDVNKFFNELKNAEITSGGMVIDGINFTTAYIKGNTFALDGVHPTTYGYGIIANQFIDAINNKFGASISHINVSTLPPSIPLAKTTLSKKNNYILKNITWKDIIM